MKLIADSGSTKTDWVCINADNSIQPVEAHTVGLNPFHMSDDEFRQVLVRELLIQLGDVEITDVYFYGSGVRPEVEERVTGLLTRVFTMVIRLFITPLLWAILLAMRVVVLC